MLLIFYLLIEHIFAQIGSLELFPSTNTIQAQTTYELKFLLQQTMPINSIITIDFSNTDIIVNNGALTKCTGSIYFTAISTDYSQCSCTSNICTIIISNSVSSSSLYLLKFGLLTNPSFVKPQIVGLTFDLLTIKKIQSYTVDVYQAGALSQINLSQSSQKVYDLNNVKLTLQSQHNIESQGQLIITFPTQILFNKLSTIVEINSLNYTGIITISGQSATISNVFNNQLNAENQFIIYLLNIQNQESVRTSNQIIIQTATKYSYLIDSIGFEIQTTIPENIDIQYLNTQDTQIVNKIATFQFTLQPALKFTNGGYLEIKFPTDLIIQTNMSCQRIIGLTLVSGTTYSCTYTGQYVKTSNLQYPNSANSMILTVSNIKNPSSTKPTGTFEFRTYDSDGYLMCVSTHEAKFTPLPDLLQATITRDITTVAMQSSYTILITPKNNIPQNGFINLNLGTQAQKQTLQQLQCLDQVNNLLSCQFDTDSKIKITLTQSINSNTQITIIIQYLINPNFVITSTSDFEIDTCDTQNYIIDQLLNIPITPQLTPNSIQQIVYYRNNDISTQQSILNIGSITQIQIQFQITSQFIKQNDGNAVIDLNGYYYLNNDETITCKQIILDTLSQKNCIIQSYLIEDDPKIYYLSKILIPNIIQNQNTNIDITITGLRSELIAGTYSHTISVQIYTLNNQLVSTGYNELGNTIIINNEVQLSQLQINSDSLITAQLSQYTIKHILKYPFDIKSRNSYLQLNLPSELGIDNLSSCLVTINTNTLECKINQNIIQIYSTITPYQLNQEIAIILSQIRNPFSTAQTSKFLLSYYYNSIKSVTVSSTYQINQPNQISVNVNRNNLLINQQSSFTFQMTLNNQVQNLIYSILLPTDQIIQKQINIKINDIQQAILIDNSNSGYLTIKFKENSCPCQISTQLTFIISGFNNPLISSNSVAQIQLLDDQNNIYQENKSIQIPGIQQGTITINSITQTATLVDDPTIISLNIINDTPYDNGIIQIQFNPDYLPFQQQNIQIQINNNLVVCTIDQLKYQLTCSNIQIKQSNLIQIININTIKWLTSIQNCQIQIQTFFGTTLLDQSVQVNCNNLLNLNTKSFSSSIIRGNKILNQNTDLNIKFTHEVSTYFNLKLPLSEVTNDPSFSCDHQSIIKSSITKDSNYLIFSLQFDVSNNNNVFDFNFLQLQNSNILPTTIQNYIIELSNDGQTISYTSQNKITPELICQGSQCSDQQLSITTFSKSTTLISTRSDISINIALPVLLKEILTFQLTMSLSIIDSQTTCYLNNTLINCQKMLRDSCTMCEQTQINLLLKNAINLDQFNSLEKVCIVLETNLEQTQTCRNIEQQYNYLLDVKNIVWINNTYFNYDGRLEFQVQFSSPLNNKYENLLKFQLINSQVDFSNAKTYLNNNQVQSSIVNNIMSIYICSQNCEVDKIYDFEISQIKFNSYTYSAQDLINLSVQRGGQLLEQSSQIQIYPKSLNLNQLTVSANAQNYVELHYSLQTSVQYQEGSQIKFKFQNNNCVQQVNIGSSFNSTCSLKDNHIIQVSIISNNIITHQSNQQIQLIVNDMICPSPYLTYKDNCYFKCPSNTYLQDQTCYQCTEDNCISCTSQQCTKCSSNYELINNKCEMKCLINNCQTCSLENNTQNCLQCITPYEIYQNQCKLKNDCQIENCNICEISNQNIICVECIPDKFKYNNSCQSQCPLGYYQNQEQQTCNICPKGCQTCSSKTDCIECQEQYILSNQQCVCKINECEQCSQIDKCDKCSEKYQIYYKNQCLNTCPIGFYEEKQSCSKCDTSCKTCNQSNQCLTCQNEFYLENSKCIFKQCPENCLTCQNNYSCSQCKEDYNLNNNDFTCSQIIQYPYFGVASALLTSLLFLAIIYETVVIILPPKLPIIPQILLTSIVIFSVLQSISNIIILFYTYLNQNTIEFILSAIVFSVTNIYYSQTCDFQNNPLMQFISSGTWVRTPLIKLKFFTKQNSQKYTNYQLIRSTQNYSHFLTNSFSIVIQISLIAIQTQNEIPYIAIIKMIIDCILLTGYILEYKFI